MPRTCLVIPLGAKWVPFENIFVIYLEMVAVLHFGTSRSLGR